MVSRTLIEYEEMLVPSGFIRIHKSSLINMRHLKKYIKGEGGQAIMSNGKSLNVGRAYKQEMLSKVSRFK
jgi:two-component system LytT family response regulator